MENDLMLVEYNGKRVLTTGQLAQVYETTSTRIKQNFNKNKVRFIQNKHYFLLEGLELKQFKDEVAKSDLVGKRASQLYLWTERGADRHCKILDTDKAWEQFDNLEDTYFKIKENNKLIGDLNTQNQMLQLAQGTQIIANVVQGIQHTINDMQEFVKDSINSKDLQIEQTAEMIGLRDKNTKLLVNQLKEKLYDLAGRKIKANDDLYIKIKYNIFKKYKVFKWEDIPIGEFNRVSADICEIELKNVM